jgi:hypothetical protein
MHSLRRFGLRIAVSAEHWQQNANMNDMNHDKKEKYVDYFLNIPKCK